MIAREELIEKLQRDLTRKTYSFVEYVTMASPYVPEGREPMWELLLRLRTEERQHAELLSRLIVALGGIPNPGLFDEGAADTNYLHIDYLYKLLIRHKEQSVKEFEQRVNDSSGFPEARAVLLKILEDEKEQLAVLRECFVKVRWGLALQKGSNHQG